MRKITLILMSLFLTMGAMAQINYGKRTWTFPATNVPDEIFTDFKGAQPTLDLTTEKVGVYTTEVRVNTEGEVKALFTYNGGNIRMDISGIELVNAEGKVAYSDYHYGWAGGNPQDNTYTLNNVTVGDYTLRIFVVAQKEDITSPNNDSRGYITLTNAWIYPKSSTADTKHFYYIKNVRHTNKFANYNGEGKQFTQEANAGAGSYWYFVEANAEYMNGQAVPEGRKAYFVYNAANIKAVENVTNGYMAEPNAQPYPAKIYYVGVHTKDDKTGLVIRPYNEDGSSWNDASGGGQKIGHYTSDDPGSLWNIEVANTNEEELIASATTTNDNAKADIDKYSAAYYYTITQSKATAAKSEIDNIDITTLAKALTSLIEDKAINISTNLINSSKVTPAAGDRFIMKNRGRSGHLRAYAEGNVKCSDLSDDLFALDLVWTLVGTETDNQFKIYNERHGVYVGALSTIDNTEMNYTSNIDDAGVYEISQNEIYTLFHAVGQDTKGYMHQSNWGGKEIVRWDNGDCSQWQLIAAPFELTTNKDNPICYAIRSGRKDNGGSYYFTLENNKVKLYNNKNIATDETAHWFFMLDENKNLKIYSLSDKDNAMGYIGSKNDDDTYTITEGNTKLTKDDSAENFAGDTYTLYFNQNKAADYNDTYFAFRSTIGNVFVSNHGGTGNYMGFYNKFDDHGTRVAFTKVSNAALQQQIATWEPYFELEGEGIHQYKISQEAKNAVATAEAIAYTKTNSTDFAAALSALKNVEYPTINAPATNKYYYLKANGKYLSNALNGGTIAAKDEKDVDNIYYLEAEGENTYLVSYQNGKYLTNPWNIGIGADPVNSHATERHKQTKTFVEGNFGYYALKYFSDKGVAYYIHVSGNSTNAGQDKTINEAQWTLEEVTSLPVTISAAKYATFHAPVAVEIADGVTAYTATINGNWVTLNEIEGGVIPANTGVVLYADVEEATTYNFDITENVKAIEGNAFRGSVATTYYTAAGTYYALGVVDGVTAFYKDKLNNNRFQNNSHKAYLFIPGASGSASLRFNFGGTTAIEEVETEATETVIYDLTGRRVNEITKAGVYIVNGRKVMVK